jgi:uncharacterized membrane protein
MRTSIDGSIEIDVSAATAYEYWTRMEEFPRFIEAIESVRRLDERRSVWRVNFGFRRQEWTAEITEIIPDKRRAWRTLSGAANAGMVNFHQTSDDRTLMTLHLDYEPRGVLQNLGDELGVMSRVIQRALEQFKDFAEGAS